MIYSFNNGLRQPLAEKSKVYSKFMAAAVATVLAVVWFTLVYYAATNHFPKFPTLGFGSDSSSASNVAEKTAEKSAQSAARAGGASSGATNFANTADSGTWTVNVPATTTPAVGGMGGGTTINPGTVVPDSSWNLPVQLPYTQTLPGTSVQAGDKQIVGTSPTDVTLN